MNGAHDSRPTFLLGQKLSELVGVTDPEKRRFHVCDERVPERSQDADRHSWQELERDALCAEAAGPSPPKRVALVCDAGLGKTTNMEWLACRIAKARGSRQVPFLLRLDTAHDLQLLEAAHANPDALLDPFAAEVARGAGVAISRLPLALQRLRSSDRITLLIDGLDHALSVANVPFLLSKLLSSEQWRNCPVWISGRPHAFDSAWSLFADPVWMFCRVEPLAEPEIRFYLYRQARGDWYDDIAPEGRSLLAVPRLLRLTAGILAGSVQQAHVEGRDPHEAVRRLELGTAADVYHLAYFTPGEYADPRNLVPGDDRANRRGLIASGLTGEAERIGLNDGDAPSGLNYHYRIKRTGALLGAIAFQMFAANPKATEPTPNLTGILEEQLEDFITDVAKRLELGGQGTNSDFRRDFNLLIKMNNGAVDFLLFRELGQRGVVWHDRTVEAFFAAHWAMKYGNADDRRQMERWKVKDAPWHLGAFEEFWTFVAELPNALVDNDRWLAAFGPYYTAPQQPTCKHDHVQWDHLMIYYSFRRMHARSPGTIVAWRQSYRDLENGSARRRRIYRDIEDGFRDIPAGVCPCGADSSERRTEVPRPVAAFRMHQWQVTNEMYEAFDPGHHEHRWCVGAHELAYNPNMPGDNPDDEDHCPVVLVTWYDAWCFAAWCGHRLPTQLEWEHACRAGAGSAWHFGNDEAELATYAWYHDNSQRSTHPVGQRSANENKLFDMHGNVEEWCEDRDERWADRRVIRGGSWPSSASQCRSASHSSASQECGIDTVGFRLATGPVEAM